MFDRWMRAFSASHAPATRRRNLAASECFCSDAGRSFGAFNARRPRRKFATNSRIFWRKNCAMAAPNAWFFRRATRRRLALKALFGATDVSRFSNRNNLRRICKNRCAARRNGEKIRSQIFVFDFRKNQNLALICSENASTVEKTRWSWNS